MNQILKSYLIVVLTLCSSLKTRIQSIDTDKYRDIYRDKYRDKYATYS